MASNRAVMDVTKKRDEEAKRRREYQKREKRYNDWLKKKENGELSDSDEEMPPPAWDESVEKWNEGEVKKDKRYFENGEVYDNNTAEYLYRINTDEDIKRREKAN